ncbi:MAG: FdhF/YdeP family oxidoreductase, partial [Deltaproteobacteria bacterium]|nr:FdhF/YdeP family oxidoreductase [Deltaproteobacteria bacterium]
MTRPQVTAGGPAAVASAMNHAVRRMGVLKAFNALRTVNQFDGFDCPGCAWPDPDTHRSAAEFCENGAKAVADEAMTGLLDAAWFAAHPVAALLKKDEFWLGQQGRIAQPLVRRAGATHYTPLSWDEAFALVARTLNGLPSPDAAAFYTSGRTSNEAAFLYQLFVRMYGTNNLPDCSNLCHESSGVALKETLGVGKGTVTLSDFAHADCILVIGQNPGTNHPRMLTTLQAAARRGCRIISINPLPEAGLTSFKNPQEVSGWVGRATPLATHHLPVRINGDVALLKGLAKEVLAAEAEAPGAVLDAAFVREHTVGFEPWRGALEQVTWEEIERESGVPAAAIREVGRGVASSRRVIACWAMGLTQHENAVGNIQEIVNLLLLGGHLGRQGAGVCPVRGHSNVQGDRTMGIYEKPAEAFLDALGKEFRFTPPRRHGLDVVDSIRAMLRGEVKVLFAVGGNFLSASPDTEATARALGKCALTVQVATKLNRSHLVTGEVGLLLPCLGRTEQDVQAAGPQFVTVENSMGVVTASRGRLAPVSPELRSEVAIIAGVAEATLGSGKMKWQELAGDYGRIREHVSRVVPGFEGFSERALKPGGFYLPNAVRDERRFDTAPGKAVFTVHPVPRTAPPEGRFVMMTIRTHDQYNTTVYGMQDRYRGVADQRRVVLMNEHDLAFLGLAEGAQVDLYSHF